MSEIRLDHFNGLPELLRRFPVGQVTCTPTFADKHTAGVREALDAVRRHGVPLRIVKAGDQLTVGDVRLDVLHPPAAGPEGSENARSLVLCVRHAGHALLTGDFEGPGLEQVLRQAPSRCDVLAVFRKNGGNPTARPRDNPAWSGGGQILRIDDDGVGVR